MSDQLRASHVDVQLLPLSVYDKSVLHVSTRVTKQA